MIAGSWSASAQLLNLSGGGISVDLPGVVVGGVASTPSASVSLSSNGLSARVSSANVAGVVAITPTSATVSGGGVTAVVSSANVAGLVSTTPTSLNVSGSGVSATVGGLNVAGVVTTTPATVALSEKGLSAVLPAVNVAGVNVGATEVNVSGSGITVALPKVDLASAAAQSHSQLTLLAGLASADTVAPIDQLLSGLSFGDPGSPDCSFGGAAALAPAPITEAWTWNAITLGASEHSGYEVRGGASGCTSTPSFQSFEQARLPAALWDASSFFGLKAGSLHLGFTAGSSDKDVQIRGGGPLRDAAFTQTGSARLTSVSMGSFALYTSGNFYAGSAVGGAWGRNETVNHALASSSDYDTSSVYAAGIVGTMLPLNETMRFDLRGTLAYQRTVGDEHVDTLGILYSDHTIESVSATLSARLFSVIQAGDAVVRPYVQAGVTQRLHYTNELVVDGVPIAFQEADTSLFTAAGLDFELSKTLQLSAGVRHDYSSDEETLTGRLGLLLRFN